MGHRQMYNGLLRLYLTDAITDIYHWEQLSRHFINKKGMCVLFHIHKVKHLYSKINKSGKL